MTLTELASQEEELLESLSLVDEDPSWTDEQKEVVKQSILAEYFAAVEQLEIKVDSYTELIRSLKARAAFRKEESENLAQLAKQDTNLAKTLEQRLILVLQGRGSTKLQTSRYKITVTQNGGKKPIIVPKEWEDDPASAPEQFHRHRIELDKETLRSVLSEGAEIEGCRISEAGFHLRIR